MQALSRKIEDLQTQKKAAIQRLSAQSSSVEEVGVLLGRLEEEETRARDQLRRLVYRNVGGPR